MDINWFHADYLPWLILLFPLVSFLVIVLFTSRNTVLSQVVGLGGIGVSWVLSMVLFVKTVWAADPALGERVYGSSLDWMSLGAYTFRMGVLVDPLTAYMLLMVPLACLMIFIYSMGYMRGDAHNSRFFAYISLFSGAMLTLVLADNLLLLFIGWEIMGFCSYSLIGFWFAQEERDGSRRQSVHDDPRGRRADAGRHRLPVRSKRARSASATSCTTKRCWSTWRAPDGHPVWRQRCRR